jgi:predicted membrane chloride channel (bestrophin family)
MEFLFINMCENAAKVFEHKVFKGGEGTALLVGASRGYWNLTLFATTGRPLPPSIMTLLYTLYVVAVTFTAMKVVVIADMSIDSFSISSVGGYLFFLLVFRSNSSYDRWWEGRKNWGSIINRTRDLTRQVKLEISEATMPSSLQFVHLSIFLQFTPLGLSEYLLHGRYRPCR